MLIPLSDSPNPRGFPLVTYFLIAVNVAVFVLVTLPLSSTPPDPSDPLLHAYVRAVQHQIGAQALRGAEISQYDLFVFAYGFRPAVPSPSALIVSLFLHAGFLHLFGNMLFLWIYGDNVENRLGRLRYLLWYLITGIAATLFHSAFFRQSQLPLVGASGAISGVLGFYFIWFPYNQVRMLFLFIPFVMRVISLSARIVLGFYLVMDNLLPFLLTRGAAGVAFGAHIGGFLTGLVAAWWMDRRALKAPADEPLAAAPRLGSPVGAIRDALAQGDYAHAAQAYLSLDPGETRDLLKADELLSIGHWLLENGRARAALAVYLRHLRDYPTGSSAAEAHLGAGLVQLRDLGDVASAYQHLLDALDLDPTPQVAAQARQALRAIGEQEKFKIGNRR